MSSAAEKLKALGPDLDAVLDELIAWIDTDSVGWIEVEQRGEQMRLRLRNALPQIVAVVEAAEEVRGMGDWVTQTRLPSALAALDEQLGDVT